MASERIAAWHAALAVFPLAALALLLSFTGADADLWGHLRFGLDMLASGHITEDDPYSYVTFGQRWINHEWLAETIFATAWKERGATGLIALKMLIGALTVGALFRQLLGYRLHAVQAVILFGVLGAPVFLPFLAIRPQIFTCLLFVLLMIVIRRAEHGSYRWLWAAPPIMLAWVNLHGGVLAGLGMLGLWSALHLPFNFQRRWEFIPPVFVAALATLINPYGPDLLFFLFDTATGSRPDIQDWRPLPLASPIGATYLAVLGGAIAGWVFGGSHPRPTLLLLTALAALLPWLAVRHLPLFSIAAIVFAGDHVAAAWVRASPDRAGATTIALPRWAMALPIAAAAGMIAIGFHEQTFTEIPVHAAESAPAGAVKLLARVPGRANVLTDYDWGEYLIWHLGPRIRCGMDGRRETVYSPTSYQQYQDFDRGTRNWAVALRTYGTDAALVKVDSPPYNLLKLTRDWPLVYEDAKAALFVRESSALFKAVRAAAQGFEPPEPVRSFP